MSTCHILLTHQALTDNHPRTTSGPVMSALCSPWVSRPRLACRHSMCCVRLLSQAAFPQKPKSLIRLDHIPYTPLVYVVCIQLMPWAPACPAPIYHHPHVPSVTLLFFFFFFGTLFTRTVIGPVTLTPTVVTRSSKIYLLVSIIAPRLCPFSWECPAMYL